jgi:hypothetical protein
MSDSAAFSPFANCSAMTVSGRTTPHAAEPRIGPNGFLNGKLRPIVLKNSVIIHQLMICEKLTSYERF